MRRGGYTDNEVVPKMPLGQNDTWCPLFTGQYFETDRIRITRNSANARLSEIAFCYNSDLDPDPSTQPALLTSTQPLVSTNSSKDKEEEKLKLVNESSELKLIPNPTSEFVVIWSENTIAKIDLLSASGAVILSERSLDLTRRKIDVSSLPRGVYFVRVELSNGDLVTKKLVVL